MTPLATLAMAMSLPACTPTMDWRAVRLEPDARLQFPCKPDRHERSVELPGDAAPARVPARMLVCDAGEVTWSATQYTLADPNAATAAAASLQAVLLDNLKARDVQASSPQVPGATPGTAWRATMSGQRPDGSAVQARALFVARGARVYQLVVLARPKADAGWIPAAQEFLDGLRWSV
ncbi:hypothetical protein [Sphaerotilus mobilis]|uniref:PsbP protein n=1 Tax=Sphaerotilus mobilis TaxID=47994 RepID=A0A4Q7LC02_9BURK|nr:hypothetical protein [Sphaerotilus mobilis]RZS47606.1 hypothetical protein EV685_3816 [Sphaerotilus mobilis]